MNGASESGRSGASRAARFAGWAITIAILAGIIYLAYVYFHLGQPPAAPISTVPARTDSIVAAVHSSGQIAPWNEARLAFKTSGQITSLPVRVGDRVKKGDVIGSLDQTSFKIQLEQAQANLASAQAKLEAVQAGPRPEDVAAAQAAVDSAQVKLDGMLKGGRPEVIAQAQGELAAAQAHLHQVQQGAQPADRAAAQSAVDQAQSTLQKDQAALADLTRPTDPLVVQNAELAVEQAKSILWRDQATRDAVCGNKANPQAMCNANDATLGADQSAIQQAEAKLAQIQEGPKPEDVAAAKSAVNSAQVQLNSAKAKLAELQAGGLPDDVAQAAGSVQQAAETVALAQRPYSHTDVAQQQDLVKQTQAQLALRQNPYTKSDLDAAKAAVDLAQSQVDLARYNLALTTLTAPFDGVVAAVNANVGEESSPSATTPVVTLVDPSDLHLDVSVDETDVARIALGMPVTVTFDAIPTKTFSGKVTAISPNAEVVSGVATYIATIALQNAEGVRPGMTGDATIVYARHDNVLIVPSRVIRTDGGNRVVGVLQGNTVVSREVTVGISDETNTEIVSGLQPGARVVVPLTEPFLSPVPAPGRS
jgi:HlyD family secretion protein